MTVVDKVPGAVDIDGHEMMPSHRWSDEYGPNAGTIAVLAEPMMKKMGANSFVAPQVTGEQLPINQETVWNARGVTAPSGFDIARRLDVMDTMGHSRHLVFGGYAIVAQLMVCGGEYSVRDLLGLDLPLDEVYELGRAGLDEHNDWAARTTAIDPERMRVVGYVIPDGSLEDLLRDTRRIIDMGVRAISLPLSTPPAGLSPASSDLDPFWALMEESRTAVVMHSGTEFGFIASPVWGRAKPFKAGKVVSTEFGLEPYSMATLHYADDNYLTTMVYGGVFERFPDLRFGIIESLAGWLGPLADNLDFWHDQYYSHRLSQFISMRPSEYLARNVRVTPFSSEPVDVYLDRYPHLSTSYCYSTDYPHHEGGTDQKNTFYEKVAPFGPEMIQKFFIDNGTWLFPS